LHTYRHSQCVNKKSEVVRCLPAAEFGDAIVIFARTAGKQIPKYLLFHPMVARYNPGLP